MQINLPDHPKLTSKAVAEGFASVEDYVRHLVEEDTGPLEPSQADVASIDDAEWQQRFNKLLSMVEPGNPEVDDSRESIYPGR